jgi:hypothetical protein
VCLVERILVAPCCISLLLLRHSMPDVLLLPAEQHLQLEGCGKVHQSLLS